MSEVMDPGRLFLVVISFFVLCKAEGKSKGYTRIIRQKMSCEHDTKIKLRSKAFLQKVCVLTSN